MHLIRPYQGARVIYNWSQSWRFNAVDDVRYAQTDADDSDFETVHLPHTNQEVPHKDFDVESYQFVSWYRKCLTLTEAERKKRIRLDFDGVMSVAEVYVNGELATCHQGGYTSFSVDISEKVKVGDNVIAVRVDSRRQVSVPPEGNIVDYLLFGGIYRSVWLTLTEPEAIADVFLYTESLEDKRALLGGFIDVSNTCSESINAAWELKLQREEAEVIFQGEDVFIEGKTTTRIPIQISVENPAVWSVDAPHLYHVTATLKNGQGILDDLVFRFGIRTIGLSDSHLLVNGNPVKLRGLNRHQMFPYIGNAAPRRLQRHDAWILKRELGLNYVRTSHYPQDPAFLDACDEFGLLVFTETPGWQHIGDEDWQDLVVTHVSEMVKRDRNHPSVFMWGTRINESEDNHALYTRTYKCAKELDGSRPIGGVRNFRGSEFLEDVFTFNDFSMGVMETMHKPQLITEFLGHMFPTKRTDEESRLVNHALHHARIVNEVHERNDVIGSSGWCAFDYNTHRPFGSGDGICYHGVMDIFRHPKFAAAFYKSQQAPGEQLVLEPATYFTFGSMDHSQFFDEHPEYRTMEGVDDAYCYQIPVFSNCDEVEVAVNGRNLGRKKPDRAAYNSLPHPPFFFAWPGHDVSGEIEATGYVNGEAVMHVVKSTPTAAVRLHISLDHDELFADGQDMACIRVSALDKRGNLTPYANRAITFQVSGPAKLVGENPIALEGGQVAVYVKALCTPGEVTIHANAPYLEGASATVNLRVVDDRELYR